MRGIVIDPGEAPKVVKLPNTEQELAHWIGGPVKLKPFGHVFAALIYTHCSGQALPCRHYMGQWFYGRLLLVGFRNSKITSLPAELSSQLAAQWKETEVVK